MIDIFEAIAHRISGFLNRKLGQKTKRHTTHRIVTPKKNCLTPNKFLM